MLVTVYSITLRKDYINYSYKAFVFVKYKYIPFI
jgi:hypothetical protein